MPPRWQKVSCSPGSTPRTRPLRSSGSPTSAPAAATECSRRSGWWPARLCSSKRTWPGWRTLLRCWTCRRPAPRCGGAPWWRGSGALGAGARLAHSAAVLDLPAPRTEVWRAAVLAAIGAAGGGDLAVKAVLTRGVEGTDRCTGWVLATAAPDTDRAREHGVRVVTLDRGYAADVAVTSPWLLQGAKYTSYAVSMAALREARRRGADDA